MKPTTKQIIGACQKFVQDYTGFECSEPSKPEFLLHDLMETFIPQEVLDYCKAVSKSEPWIIHAKLARSNRSVDVLIQLEPISDVVECALALSWCMNTDHDIELVRHPADMNFLCQAIEASIPINRYETELVRDSNSGHLKDRCTLDPGSVALAFELAGVPAPRNLESWRKPSGVDVPERATIASDPDFGAATVHYHDGLFALVSSADRMQVKLVHLQHIESAATEELNGFLKSIRKSERKPKAAKFEEDGAALAAKWLD